MVVVTEARLAALVLGREPFVTGQHLLCPLPTGLYVLVGAGALMMAVGFFGCCGATRESQCVLGSVSGERWGGTWQSGYLLSKKKMLLDNITSIAFDFSS